MKKLSVLLGFLLFISTNLIAQTVYDDFKARLNETKLELDNAKDSFEKIKIELNNSNTNIEMLSQDDMKKKELKQAKKISKEIRKEYEKAKKAFYNADEEYLYFRLLKHNIEYRHALNTNTSVLKLKSQINNYKDELEKKKLEDKPILEAIALDYCYFLAYYRGVQLRAMSGYAALAVAKAYIKTGIYTHPPILKELAASISKIEENWNAIDRKINSNNNEIDKILLTILNSGGIYRHYNSMIVKSEEYEEAFSGLQDTVSIPYSTSAYYDAIYAINLGYKETKKNYLDALNGYQEGKIKKSILKKEKDKLENSIATIWSKFENLQTDIKHLEEWYDVAYQNNSNFVP